MKRMMLTAALLLAGAAGAQEKVDLDMTGRIRAEAFNRSQVMATLGELTEQVGPRLTGSPAMSKANAWARGKFSGWGLSNAHDESMGSFGRGWEFSDASVVMLTPRAFPLHALPKAWAPGTTGPVDGDAMLAKLESKADLEKYKGKLRGKVVLISDPRDYKFGDKPDMQRYSEEELHDLVGVDVPADRSPMGDRDSMMKRFRERTEFGPLLNQFLVDEGVLATISISGRDNGIHAHDQYTQVKTIWVDLADDADEAVD